MAALLLAGACTSGGGATGTPAAPSGAGPTPTAPPAGSIQISGAGATFPFPLYSRWFYEYAFVDPAVKFNYQSIGSGGGIKQITEQDGRLRRLRRDPERRADRRPRRACRCSPRSPARTSSPTTSASSRTRIRSRLDGATLADIFLGKITKWNDPAIAALNPGVDAAGQGHHRRPPLRWLGHHLHLHRLPVDRQRRLEVEGRQRHVGRVAGRPRRQGQRGRGRHAPAERRRHRLRRTRLRDAEQAAHRQDDQPGRHHRRGDDRLRPRRAMADFGGDMPDTLARSIVNAPGKDSWPIAGYTYLLLYLDQTDCAKAPEARRVREVGPEPTARSSRPTCSTCHFPTPFSTQVLAKLATITCNGTAAWRLSSPFGGHSSR